MMVDFRRQYMNKRELGRKRGETKINCRIYRNHLGKTERLVVWERWDIVGVGDLEEDKM